MMSKEEMNYEQPYYTSEGLECTNCETLLRGVNITLRYELENEIGVVCVDYKCPRCHERFTVKNYNNDEGAFSNKLNSGRKSNRPLNRRLSNRPLNRRLNK